MLKIKVRKRSIIQKDTRVGLFNIFIFTFNFSKSILSGRNIFDSFLHAGEEATKKERMPVMQELA